MTPPRKSRASSIRAADVPTLAAFARAYLHQDVAVERALPGDSWAKTAASAAMAFITDSPDDRRALADDLARLVQTSRRWSTAKLRRFFEVELGAAWIPESIVDLETLQSALQPPSHEDDPGSR